MRGKLGQEVLKFVVGFLLLGACVELLAVAFGLPHASAILSGVGTLWAEGTLAHDVQVSTARWLIGWLTGTTAGVVLGLLTGRIRPVGIMIEGLLVLFRAIPFISLVPLSMRIFGLAETGKVFLVAWASAGVCWVVVHQASRAIPPHLLWRAKSLGASPRKWVFRVLLPSCSDGIYAGCRAALSLGLIVVAVAEMSGVYERSSGYWWSEGLGYRLFRSLDESRDDLLLASILTFALLGIVAERIFVWSWISTGRIWFWWRQKQVANFVARARIMPQKDEEDWRQAGALEVTGLQAGYNGKTIIRDLSFTVPAGATTCTVGPSGCGKTTLIRAIAHFSDETFQVSGRVVIGGIHISTPGPEVGVVLQDAPVFDHMTVWDNVMFGNRFDDDTVDQADQSAWRLLYEFGLDSFASQRAGTLSGGQRQRLALATALANRPQLLLLDEPFGALDAITRRQLQRFFWRHVHGRVTAVFVTHDLEEALLVGDRVRVGAAPESETIKVDKHGLPPHQWELDGDFGRLRTKLIAALEKAAPNTAEGAYHSQRTGNL